MHYRNPPFLIARVQFKLHQLKDNHEEYLRNSEVFDMFMYANTTRRSSESRWVIIRQIKIQYWAVTEWQKFMFRFFLCSRPFFLSTLIMDVPSKYYDQSNPLFLLLKFNAV